MKTMSYTTLSMSYATLKRERELKRRSGSQREGALKPGILTRAQSPRMLGRDGGPGKLRGLHSKRVRGTALK